MTLLDRGLIAAAAIVLAAALPLSSAASAADAMGHHPMHKDSMMKKGKAHKAMMHGDATPK